MCEESVSNGFRQLVTLAAMGATGKGAHIENIDWRSVVSYAQEQAVVPLVGAALMQFPEIECPELLRQELLKALRNTTETGFIRKIRILNLLEEMRTSGIDVRIIKGYPIAACYSIPESRISHDTDILIPPKQETQTCDFLRARGFHMGMRFKTDNHVVGQHPNLGVVEVHVNLYTYLSREIWFHDASGGSALKEASVQAFTSDMSYKTLGYTDHLIFLTLHMTNHFIYEGAGLRMLLDIALFFSTHRNKIDARRYWQLMERLRLNQLVSNLLWAMIGTGCFDKNDFPGLRKSQSTGTALLLHDLEAGGIMGTKTEQRYDGSYEYNRHVLLRTKTPMQYRVWMLFYKFRCVINQMLLQSDALLKLYPILEKHPWIKPFARIHHVFTYSIRKIRDGELRKQIRSDTTPLPEEARRRVELFKALGMIGDEPHR